MDAYLQTFLQQFQRLKIQLEEIKSATDNFNSKNCIGVGGFGKVYKGELSHYSGRSVVAIKRLDRSNGQGTPEFLKEITTLSRYSHENLISLLGFCYEEGEMILVYKHASRGSLDRYLNSPHLTWSQRIKICLDAAKGLSYLHDPRETHQRLIHCDIKSANILLDDQWNAKVSDLGLSVIGSANEQQSFIVTLAAGTLGYCDPQYVMTHTLTKESDIYSFGVVLFEVLCGTLCYTSTGKILVPMWIECYEQRKLNDIIFKNPTTEPLDQGSVKIISDIAYQCMKESREDRPKMAEVVTELETALESQEFSKWKPPFDVKEMLKATEPPLNYSSNGELRKLLSKGFLLNGGKTWFSINKNGEHCEMISFAECLVSGAGEFETAYNSRFAMGCYCWCSWLDVLKVRVKTQLLSPGITYTVNLMFQKIESKYPEVISLYYKLEGETETSVSHLAYESDDGYCWMCEVYQFTSDQRTVDLEILFEGFTGTYNAIKVEGVSFLPLEEVELRDEKQPILDSDANWEEKLPNDYEDIIKLSKHSLQWTAKREAYSLIRKGFLINDGQEWVSLDNNGKKCYMLSAGAAFGRDVDESIIQSSPESRFGEVFHCNSQNPDIIAEIKSQLLSSDTTYAIYLIYKLPKDLSMHISAPIRVMGRTPFSSVDHIYLGSPQTPVFKPKTDQNTHNPTSRPRIKGLPRQRNDGWMEVQIWEYRTTTSTIKTIFMHLELYNFDAGRLKRLIIQGVEFRGI